jgi:hypothetical protein
MEAVQRAQADSREPAAAPVFFSAGNYLRDRIRKAG